MKEEIKGIKGYLEIDGVADTFFFFFFGLFVSGLLCFFIVMVIDGVRSQGSEEMESSKFNRKRGTSSTDMGVQEGGRNRRRWREVGLAGRRL